MGWHSVKKPLAARERAANSVVKSVGSSVPSVGLRCRFVPFLREWPSRRIREKCRFFRHFLLASGLADFAQRMRAERMAQLDILVGRARVLYLKPRTDRLKAGRRA